MNRFPVGSAEYVVLHAKRQAQKGKNPSLPFIHVSNPRKALIWADRLAYFPVAGSYLAKVSLERYICSECGVSKVKLWREYQTLKVNLLCATCACKNQEKDISTLDADGRIDSEISGKTDQIGWYIPAVPSEESTLERMVYWGYCSVPGPGIDWWKKLPNLIAK